MNLPTRLSILFLIVMFWTSANGTTQNTAASGLIASLRNVMSRYFSNGGDVNSLSMDEIINQINRDGADAKARAMFLEHLIILGSSGPVDMATNARMIALTSEEIIEDRRDSSGRYVIWLQDGEVMWNWESEDHVKALLASAHLPLPNKGVWTQAKSVAVGPRYTGQNIDPPPRNNEPKGENSKSGLPQTHFRLWLICGTGILAAVWLIRRAIKRKE